MASSLEQVYTGHHRQRRGRGFVLLGQVRGAFLAKAVGTGKRVLDIGCRDGALTSYFVPGNHVTGLDIDAEALEIAQRQLGIETRQVDLNGDWGVEPASFDAAVAAEVLEHLYYPATVLQKLYDCLKPGGILAGTVPHAFSWQSRLRILFGRKRGTPLEDPTHINHFMFSEFRTLLQHRFSDVRFEFIVSRRLRWLAALVGQQRVAYGLMFSCRRPV